MKRENIKKSMALVGLILALTACTNQGGSITIPSLTLPSVQSSEAGSSGAGNADTNEEVSVKVTTLNRSFTIDVGGTKETMLEQVTHQVHLVSGNEEVAKILEEKNENTAGFYDGVVLSTLEGEAPAYFNNEEYRPTAALEYTTDFRRVDGAVLSLFYIEYGYLGGVHPYTLVGCDNFDMQTGKEIKFADVVKDVKAFAKVTMDEIANSEEYGKNYRDGAYSRGLEEDTVAYLEDEAIAWTITKEGIELWYADYMAGAYASGHINILIPYEAHKDLIDGKYFENVEDYDVTSRVAVDRAAPETLDASDYCYQNDGVLLYDFNLVSGIYTGEDGSTLEISSAGYYVCQNESVNNPYYVSGELRVGEAMIRMFTDELNEATERLERKEVGQLVFQSDGFNGGLFQNEGQTYTLTEKYEKEGGDTSSPWGGKETRYDGCDIVLFEGVMNEHPFDEADMSIDEYTRTFWLYSEKDVKDLKLFNVNMVPSSEYGLAYEAGEVWFSKARFTTDDLWKVTISIPGDLPCNGFSYVNAAGVTKYYAIGDSGMDGSLYLTEFVPQ